MPRNRGSADCKLFGKTQGPICSSPTRIICALARNLRCLFARQSLAQTALYVLHRTALWPSGVNGVRHNRLACVSETASSSKTTTSVPVLFLAGAISLTRRNALLQTPSRGIASCRTGASGVTVHQCWHRNPESVVCAGRQSMEAQRLLALELSERLCRAIKPMHQSTVGKPSGLSGALAQRHAVEAGCTALDRPIILLPSLEGHLVLDH